MNSALVKLLEANRLNEFALVSWIAIEVFLPILK